MNVTHDQVHCHWKWQCYFPLFSSFVNRIKASLPNNAMVWQQRLPHLMPGDHFLSGNLNGKVLATSPCDPEEHIRAYMTWINGCSSSLGSYLAMVNRTCRTCSTAVRICVEIRGGQKIILPIITKVSLDIPENDWSQICTLPFRCTIILKLKWDFCNLNCLTISCILMTGCTKMKLVNSDI